MDELEMQAQNAIAMGANPEAVNARLAQMRAQMQPQQQPQAAAQEAPQQSGVDNFLAPFKEAGDRFSAIGQEVGRNILNAPHNLLPKYAAPLVDPNRDYFAEKGLKKGLADEIIQTGVEFTPFGGGAAKIASAIPKIGKGAKALIASVGSNAAYGAAANPEDRAKGAAVGTAIGVGAPVVGKVVDKAIVQPASKFIAQQAVPYLTKKAAPLLNKATNPQQAAQEFNAVYKAKADQSNKLWGDTEKIAAKIDDARTNPFDVSSYTKYLDDFENNYLAKTPAQAAKLDSAAQLVGEMRRVQPQNIQDVVALRQSLNQTLSDFSKTKNIAENAESKKVIKGLKNTFDEIIDKNTPKGSAEAQAFKDTWSNANKSTQDLKAFYDAPSKLGVKKTRQEMQSILKEGGEAADGAIFDLFEPSASQTGAGGLQHLSKLVGETKAKDYLKGYMFRKIEKGNAIEALQIYQKLSPTQRDAIFKGSKEGKLLQSASRIWSEIGKDEQRFLSHMPWMHGLATAGVPGLVAGGTALAMGEPWEKSLGIGLGVGAAALGAGKAVASQSPNFLKIPEVTTRLATEGRKNAGKGLALGAQTFYNKERQ